MKHFLKDLVRRLKDVLSLVWLNSEETRPPVSERVKRSPASESSPISIRLPKELIDRIDELAHAEMRSRANYILVILEEVVRRGGLALPEEDK